MNCKEMSMKVQNNFVNVVTLGNFNPAILKSSFLVDVCQINLGTPTKENIIPIQSQIDFKNISFLACLDRFIVTDTNNSDFSKSEIPVYLGKYLSKLPYTPISACGINFNIDISEVDEKKLQSILTADRTKLIKMLNVDEVVIGIASRCKLDNTQENFNLNLGYTIKENNSLFRITIEKISKLAYRLNYNYEIRGLEKKPENVNPLLINAYGKRFEEYDALLKTIF